MQFPGVEELINVLRLKYDQRQSYEIASFGEVRNEHGPEMLLVGGDLAVMAWQLRRSLRLR